jgi:putative acetyltransferase
MISTLTSEDVESLEEVFLNSFSEDEAPSTFKLMREIIEAQATDSSICLGYVVDGKLVAGVAFSPVFMDEASSPSACILAPLAVHASYQKMGIARKLIETGKARLSERGVEFLLVYGDPAFYSRFGFSADLGGFFVPPYPLEFAFGWQAMNLGAAPTALAAPADGRKHRFRCITPLSDASLW